MKKSVASPTIAANAGSTSTFMNHVNQTHSTHLNNNSNNFSSLKSNDASSSYTSSSTTNLNFNSNTNYNTKSSSTTYSPSLTTTNTAGTNTNNSLLNADMIGSNPSNNSSISNNTSSHSPHKQSFNQPHRSFIGSASNGGGSIISGVVLGGGGGVSSGMTNTSGVTDKKIGHREVKDGVVHYKKVPTNELKKAIQFGIVHSISVSSKHPERDLLMQDFQTVETIVFPKSGSAQTPAHTFNDFKLKVYAPYGFKYLRKKFSVDEADFMHSISDTDLIEISNPGASGSVFYKTSDDKYLLKTVQYQECEFLKTLLAGIYLNFLQNLISNKHSLLPIIYGLYCYQKLELTSILSDKTNIRIVIMNNILPSDIKMHEKYDLKGSLYKRKASKQERAKTTPTFKDLDFLDEHPEGILLDEKYYDTIVGSLKRDCLILKSFGIMDYSLLLGIHNLEKEQNNNALDSYYNLKMTEHPLVSFTMPDQSHNNNSASAAMFNLSPNEYKANKYNKFFSISAVPARSAKGDRLLLYMGIIDILQSYRLKKRLEHTFKSMITDGSQISVVHPAYYESRFIEFITNKVFKKQTLKSSPARKRTIREQTVNKPKELASPSEPMVHSQMNNSSLNQQETSVPSSPPSSSSANNYKNIKPIDSVDSIVNMKSPTTDSKANKFDNISEISLGNKDGIAKKTDNDNLSHTSSPKRTPVISIIEHYDAKAKLSNQSSPVQERKDPQEKTFNYLVDNHPKFNGSIIKPPVNEFKRANGSIILGTEEIEMIKPTNQPRSSINSSQASNKQRSSIVTITDKVFLKKEIVNDQEKLLSYLRKQRKPDPDFDGITIIDTIIPLYRNNSKEYNEDSEDEEFRYRFKKVATANNTYSRNSRYY